jgi:hypothetical protein
MRNNIIQIIGNNNIQIILHQGNLFFILIWRLFCLESYPIIKHPSILFCSRKQASVEWGFSNEPLEGLQIDLIFLMPAIDSKYMLWKWASVKSMRDSPEG